jgi:hypothetical protein
VTAWLLAVDPGQAACGAALFVGGRLQTCAWVRHPSEHDDSLESLRTMGRTVVAWASSCGVRPPDLLDFVCEWPQAYYGAKSQAPVADLMPMCGIDGVIAALISGSCERILPAEWGAPGKPKKPKGRPWPPYVVEIKLGLSPQMPTESGRLDDEERRIYRKGTYGMSDGTRHNVADAVAIGLHALGRGFEATKRRVYAR